MKKLPVMVAVLVAVMIIASLAPGADKSSIPNIVGTWAGVLYTTAPQYNAEGNITSGDFQEYPWQLTITEQDPVGRFYGYVDTGDLNTYFSGFVSRTAVNSPGSIFMSFIDGVVHGNVLMSKDGRLEVDLIIMKQGKDPSYLNPLLALPATSWARLSKQ